MTQRCFSFAAAKLPSCSGLRDIRVHIHAAISQSLVDRDVSLNIVYFFQPENEAMIGAVSLASLRIDSIFPNQQGVNPSPPWGGGTQGTSEFP